jgi:hypothetical protein
MKITDIITEGHQSTPADVPDFQEPVMGKAVVFRDNGGLDRTHNLYRIMLAAAVADGKTQDAIPGIDGLTWHSKYNTAHPYTKEEFNMMMSAFKTIGADWHQPVMNDQCEPDEIHTKSPMTPRGAIVRKR